MREIKFRGMTIDNNKMVYGDLLQYRVYPVIFDKDKTQHEVDAKTVGQYTGLKDKNGKEIYEGDIVKSDKTQTGFMDGNEKGIVKYYRAEFVIVTQNYHQIIGAWIEVKGNIYKNPELLKIK